MHWKSCLTVITVNTMAMAAKRESIFKSVVSGISLFGMEKEFHDLSQYPGPQLPEWLAGKTLYEVYVRAYSQQGDFKGLTRRLDELQAMGIDLIWLMPIYPIGHKGRKGSLGSPYAVRDYFHVNPEYGSEDEFIQLVRKAHDLNMKVILDMVLNHIAPDYKELAAKPELVQYDRQGAAKRKIADWSDVADLNYSSQATWRHVLKIMRYWIEKFDVDGYRCDVAGMVPIEFWEWAVPRIRKVKKDVFLLAEWESPFLHQQAFHATYDWSLYELMKMVAQGQKKAKILTDWVLLKSQTYPQNSIFLRFLENHDKPRAMEVFGREALPAYLTFIFTIDGIPLIYNGQETGADRYLSLFEKDTIDWQRVDRRMMDLIKRLVRLRKEYPALSSKKLQPVDHPHEDTLLIYDKEELRVVIHFGDETLSSEIVPRFSSYEILFNSERLFNKEAILPYQAFILKPGH